MTQDTMPTRPIPVFNPRKRDRGAQKEVPFGKLIIIYGDHAGREYHLGSKRMLIGRTDQCDILIGDSSVSRKHARTD